MWQVSSMAGDHENADALKHRGIIRPRWSNVLISLTVMSQCLYSLVMLPVVAAAGETSTYTSSWDSSPFHLEKVTDNNLGLTCKSCSASYCSPGINGLDLWISLGEVSTELFME